MRHSPHQLISVRGSSPYQGPSCTCEGGRGLQGGWDPSEARHLSAMPFHGHTSTLDRCVPLLVPQDLLSGWKSLAPVAPTPVSTLRHRAINSLRATATMAIRRIRPLAVPTRSRNQEVKGLL